MELLIYISKAAAILVLFYLVYIFVLQKNTLFTANRHYLLSGILAAITFPFIEIKRRVFVELSPNITSVYQEMIPVEPSALQDSFIFDWWQIALLVYALGAVFMMFRFLKQLISLIILLYKYPSEKKDGYRYIRTSENTLPFSFFRNIVFNPALHSQPELEMILKHEEVHASQWHSVDIIVSNLMLIFQWINPFAWLYKKGVEENLEFIADNATAQQIESVKQYQLALVKASSTTPIPALTNNFYQSFIKKRIVMLNKRTSKKINAWKLMLVLPLLALFLWSFNVKEEVTYIQSSEPEFTFTNSFNTSEGASEEIKSPTTPASKVEAILASTTGQSLNHSEVNSKLNISAKDVEVTITKKTTKSELEAIKVKLKASGIELDLSNLKYNKANEITSISISYKNANGNSGTYSVNSEEPINSIVIKSEGNQMSVRSAGSGNYSYSSDEDEKTVRARSDEQQARMKMRKAEMKEKHIEMEEHRAEMKVYDEEMKERHEEMEMRHKEVEERHEERDVRRAEMHDRQLERRDRQRARKSSREVIIEDGDRTEVHSLFDNTEDGGLFEDHDDHDSDQVIVKDRIRARSDKDRNQNHIFRGRVNRITKNTTNNELDKLKNDYKAQGVSFSYSALKRNNTGEIIKIKLKIKDNKGTTSSSSFDEDGKAIETIIINTKNGISVTKRPSH